MTKKTLLNQVNSGRKVVSKFE